MRCKSHHRRSRPKTYKTNPYIDRLARPRLGLVTAKYNRPSSTDLHQSPCCCCTPSSRCPGRPRLRRITCRLLQLAQPYERNTTYKYRPARTYLNRDCLCPPPPFSDACWTRTKQLALPYVRNLLDTRQRFRRCCYDQRHTMFMEMRIQASMATEYSRLAGVKKPQKRKPPNKWDEERWIRHKGWLSTRATPKRLFEDEIHQVARDCRQIDYDRIDRLAQPRYPVPPYSEHGAKCSDPINPISPNALKYKTKPYFIELSKPHTTAEPQDDEFGTFESEYEPPAAYAKIKSAGIASLAEPRPRQKRKRYQRGDNASVIFEVSKEAMKAKPNATMERLAVPRKNLQANLKPNPFDVSKAACERKPLDKKKAAYYVKLSTQFAWKLQQQKRAA